MTKALAPIQRFDGSVGPSLDVEAEYRRHARLVGQWALRLGGPGVDVEDVIQEVFFKVQRDAATFRGDSSFTTWLYGITFNEVRQRRRKGRWRRWLGGLLPDEVQTLPAPQPSPMELVEHREDVARLYQVLDRLPDKYRTVLVLFELEHRSGEEIATLMGARVETVWVWLHRARAKFVEQFQRVEAEEGR